MWLFNLVEILDEEEFGEAATSLEYDENIVKVTQNNIFKQANFYSLSPIHN